MLTGAIPVVDLAEPPDAVARALDIAYRDVGFCYIVNHGVAADAVAGVFEASRRFHSLPDAEKAAIAIDSTHRGYIAMATSTLVTSSVEAVRRPNQSESFIIGRPMDPDDPEIAAGTFFAGVNRWPAAEPGIEAPVLRYQAEMEALCRRLTHHVSRALGMPDDHLDACFARPTTYLRLLWYPPRPDAAPDDLYGAAPHTDYGFITVLAQDDSGGLEVRLPDGSWAEAPPIPGSFVLNSADILRIWSNGRWLSTPHRVVNRSGHDRYSVPFFYDPHVSVDVSPLPSCGEPVLDSANYGDYVMSRIRANYSQHDA